MRKWLLPAKSWIFSTRWIIVINLFLAGVIGYNSVQLIVATEMTPIKRTNVTASTQSALPLAKEQPSLDITPLVKSHLFGNPLKAAAPDSTVLPPTQLNLKLQGIYYSNRPETSFAVVITTEGKSNLYRVGEYVDTRQEILLQEIQPKQVILQRNGRAEILQLINVKTSETASTPPALAAMNNPVSENTSNTSPAVDRVTPERLLGYYQRQLQNNPYQLSQLIRVAPVTEGNSFMGYRVSPGVDTSLMSKFGLQSGDVVTAINGVALDSPMRALGLVQQLTTANQLEVQLLRDGQTLSLSFAIQQ